jgi:hypothetical protein
VSLSEAVRVKNQRLEFGLGIALLVATGGTQHAQPRKIEAAERRAGVHRKSSLVAADPGEVGMVKIEKEARG